MSQALEALEEAHDASLDDDHRGSRAIMTTAIASLRAALAEGNSSNNSSSSAPSPAALRAAVIEECAKEVGAYDDQAWFELTQEDCAAAIRKLKERA
jgi:hypothetical protein